MARTSRIPGFHKITVRERHALVGDVTGVDTDVIAEALAGGGLRAETADKFVENVLGSYGLPFAVALNVRVNARDYVVPMVVEEPSVVAAASSAAKMVRGAGGYEAEVDPPVMIAQVQLVRPRDPAAAERAIVMAKSEPPFRVPRSPGLRAESSDEPAARTPKRKSPWCRVSANASREARGSAPPHVIAATYPRAQPTPRSRAPRWHGAPLRA